MKQTRTSGALRRLPPYWLSRSTVALEVLVAIVIVSWFEDESLTAKAIEHAGRAGWGLIIGLFVCCFVALADVVVNDLMPERFAFLPGLNQRHIGFLGMALFLATLSLLITHQMGFTTLVLVYWLNAGLAALIAYLDIFTRLRQ